MGRLLHRQTPILRCLSLQPLCSHTSSRLRLLRFSALRVLRLQGASVLIKFRSLNPSLIVNRDDDCISCSLGDAIFPQPKVHVGRDAKLFFMAQIQRRIHPIFVRAQFSRSDISGLVALESLVGRSYSPECNGNREASIIPFSEAHRIVCITLSRSSGGSTDLSFLRKSVRMPRVSSWLKAGFHGLV
jgi:hypothetical protein